MLMIFWKNIGKYWKIISIQRKRDGKRWKILENLDVAGPLFTACYRLLLLSGKNPWNRGGNQRNLCSNQFRVAHHGGTCLGRCGGKTVTWCTFLVAMGLVSNLLTLTVWEFLPTSSPMDTKRNSQIVSKSRGLQRCVFEAYVL